MIKVEVVSVLFRSSLQRSDVWKLALLVNNEEDLLSSVTDIAQDTGREHQEEKLSAQEELAGRK